MLLTPAHLTQPILHQVRQAIDTMPPWLLDLQRKPLEWFNLRDLPIQEPTTLHIRTPMQWVGEPFRLETFAFLLDQLPALETIQWEGPGDPFEMPALIPCLLLAQARFPALTIQIKTPVQASLESIVTACDEVPIDRVTFDLVGHTPSAFGQLTGLSPQGFPAKLRTARRVINRRVHQPFANPALKLNIALRLTRLNLPQLEDVIDLAEGLGGDCLILENAPPDDPRHGTDALMAQMPEVQAIWQQLNPLHHRIPVIWPSLLDEGQTRHGVCAQPAQVVSLALESLLAYPCSQWPDAQPTARVYQGDFWNQAINQALRQVHDTRREKRSASVPAICQRCSHNCQSILTPLRLI